MYVLSITHRQFASYARTCTFGYGSALFLPLQDEERRADEEGDDVGRHRWRSGQSGHAGSIREKCSLLGDRVSARGVVNLAGGSVEIVQGRAVGVSLE